MHHLALLLCICLGLAPVLSAVGASSVVGPTTVCIGGTNSYVVATDSTNGIYAWSIGTNNTAGALIAGENTNSTVLVVASTNGGFDLECAVDIGGTNEYATTNVLVLGWITSSALTNQIVCPGGSVSFATTITGDSSYSILWRKDGDVIPDATNASLTLIDLNPTNAGTYCVEVVGSCNNLTNCATLEIMPPATLVGPTNLLLQCLAEVPAPDTNAVTATNAISVFFLGDAAVTNLCEITITRTYGAVNSCGTTSTCAQLIFVHDTEPPVLMAPSNQVVEAGSLWDFGTPTVTDNCGDTNIIPVISGTVTNPLCGLTFEAIRTWSAMDACSNIATCSQTITIVDSTPPVFTGLTNQMVEFGNAWDFVVPTAADVADGTNVTITAGNITTNSLCGNTYQALRTWTATDSCSNAASFTQTVIVQDTTPPLLTGLTNRVVEFGTAWDFLPPLAEDIADGTNVALIVTGDTTNALCGNTYEAIRTWLATDSCSNAITFTQSVAVVDTTPPAFAGTTNRTVECGAIWDFEAPSVTDIADGTNVLLTITDTTTNALCGQTFSATRIWTATDSCSNAATFTQVVTILDTTPPVLVCISNQIVECGDAWDFLPPTATDVCGGANVTITILNTTTNPLVGQTYSATRVWSATDECGNSNTCSQTVTILDRIAPDIFCPSNIVVECVGGAGNPVSFNVTAFDGCDTNVIVTALPPSGSLFSLGTNTVLCTATDDSGNSNQCTFLVVVQDTTPPQIVCPANMIVSEAPRDSGGAVVTFASPTVLDTCDSTPQMTSLPVSGSVFPVGTNTVTWTAVDSSGNSNTCTFTVRVIPYRLFVVSNTDDSGSGSLRQAILDSNDAPDDNLIIFNLTGSGPFNIDLLSPLPPVTSAVTIDGWTQGGSNAAPVVELRGSSNTFDGLTIQSGRSTVRGLSFHGFATAILLGGGTNVVQGNSIGVDGTGVFAFGNEFDGIYIDSPGNQIGGTASGEGNLISGNSRNGITLASPAAINNQILGNIVGAGLAGTNAQPNAGHGIFLTNGAALNLIGGTDSNAGNNIAFNGAAGVALDASAGPGNSILGNSISGNVGLGIDLGVTGITANDSDDSDSGPNGLQNYPVLSDARSVAGVTVIDGSLSSAPNTGYTVQFFLNDTADSSGHGEGLHYLGSTPVETKGNGTGDFSFSLPLTAVYTQFITATATGPDGNTSEFSPVVQVRTPPVIDENPISTNSVPGQSVTFCAHASGTPPIQYQWRLNGVNIAGATNPCYTIVGANVGDGGTYSVIIGNVLGASATTSAALLLGGGDVLTLPTGDNFADAVDISGYGNGTNGVLAGNNILATLEPLEPPHAGKPGGRSVWYRWCTPAGSKGIATFRTLGSTFDTVMAVYRGSSISNLYESASDEDTGRFYSSEVRFNAFYNGSTLQSCYYIAVDGLGGAGGPFVLLWEEEKTSHMLPVILVQPLSQTVPPGSSVTFSNLSVPECASGHLDCNPVTHWEPNNFKKEKLTYQWYFQDVPIPGATDRSFTITNVQAVHVGDYVVRVFTPWQHLDSRKATLQINYSGDDSQSVQAVDKFLDALFANVWFVGPPPDAPAAPAGGGPSLMAAGVVRGYTGTQIFNTAGSATEPGEVICGVTGGSSEWITLVAEQSGTLFLNTDGSSYDTVMAVYRRNPTNAAVLQLLNCDNNAGIDGKDSSLAVDVQMGSTNYVVVDGVNGAVGTLFLNYSLATTTIMKVAGKTADGANIVQVNGRPSLNFKLQVSSDMKNWDTILTTNAPTGILDYIDNDGKNQPRRFYRALILP